MSETKPTIAESILRIRTIGHEVIEERDKLKKQLKRSYIASIISFGIAALSVGMTFLEKYHPDLFASLERGIGSYASRILVSVVVILLGVGAYYFKRYSQLWYGSVEVIVGAASGISIAIGLRPNESMFSRWAALAGCVYVIARGLNNISDARIKVKTV
jgi:hypothetical protein